MKCLNHHKERSRNSESNFIPNHALHINSPALNNLSHIKKVSKKMNIFMKTKKKLSRIVRREKTGSTDFINSILLQSEDLTELMKFQTAAYDRITKSLLTRTFFNRIRT